MAITLSPDTTKPLQTSIQRYAAENLDQEIGPSVYNKAIADAQAYFQGRVADLEAVCYEPEFTYWPPRDPGVVIGHHC